MVVFTSPGGVVGMPSTPPRRTSWVPTSPSPLRNSFTSKDESEEDDDEGTHSRDYD